MQLKARRSRFCGTSEVEGVLWAVLPARRQLNQTPGALKQRCLDRLLRSLKSDLTHPVEQFRTQSGAQPYPTPPLTPLISTSSSHLSLHATQRAQQIPRRASSAVHLRVIHAVVCSSATPSVGDLGTEMKVLRLWPQPWWRQASEDQIKSYCCQ